MLLLSTLYKTILDAIFPLSSTEKELLSLSPDAAYMSLPHVSDFSGIAVPLPRIRSVFTYADERVQKLIWNIKYKKSSHALVIGGYALFQVTQHVIEEDQKLKNVTYIIIPIPISTERRKERGYNQCELLVEKIQQFYKKQSSPTNRYILFENNLLIRSQHTDRQTLKKRSERLENTQELFVVNAVALDHIKNISLLGDDRDTSESPAVNTIISTVKNPQIINMSSVNNGSIENIHIIIIDDVITTGSTMHEAVQTLRNAGFIHITPLSLAH